MGISLSVLFGHGKISPKIMPATIAGAILLLVFESLYAREVIKRTKKPITTSQMVMKIIVLGILVVPEVAIIFFSAFLWPILLPILGIYILVLSYILLVKITDKTH